MCFEALKKLHIRVFFGSKQYTKYAHMLLESYTYVSRWVQCILEIES